MNPMHLKEHINVINVVHMYDNLLIFISLFIVIKYKKYRIKYSYKIHFNKNDFLQFICSNLT